MAGDRRATSGNLISHRTMEKVFPADRHSGVAIAGAAGPAMEMVKLFQLQLEHYEKVEGTQLSLEGKANQLAAMVRNHLPAAMQGFAVVPLFAGYDLRRAMGRLFQYDVTGGRYEEADHASTGSGSLHAGTVVKLGFRDGLDRGRGGRPGAARAVAGRRRRLGHRRPRPHPRHLPGGRHDHRATGFTRIDDGEVAARRFEAAQLGRLTAPADRRRRSAADMSMPFYVAPEQVMKDRADYARKGIARGRSAAAVLYADGILIAAENSSATLHKVSEIYDRIAFAGVGKYNEFDQLRIAGVRHADLKGFSYSREDVDARSLANAYAQMLGQIFTHEMKPMEVEILVAEVGRDRGRRPDLPHPLRRLRGRRGPLQRDRRRRRGHRQPSRGGLPARPRPGRRAAGRRRRAGRSRPAAHGARARGRGAVPHATDAAPSAESRTTS